MENTNFMIELIAKLNEQLSKKQIRNDLKKLDNSLSVKVLAKLATALSKRQLKKELKQLNDLYVQVETRLKTDKSTKKKLASEIGQLQKNLKELKIKVDVDKSASTDTIKSVVSATKAAQQYADRTSITLNLETHKEKAINDILYIGQKYSSLFSNISASKKYENLLNSAYSISDKSQLQAVKAQISAFTSELKVHGLAIESTGDKWKKLIDRAKDLFSAATLVRVAFTQVRQAISTTLDLDKVYTDLVKVSGELERNDYAEYLSRVNQKAKELATTQKGLIEGATEFSKSGYDLSTSDKLAEISTILANVGEMNDSDSAKAIISGVQAYDIIDGYTDVVDKADALISKYNEIGNTASISTAEIAQGVQKVGSVFADANTSVDEFMALLSAGNRQYQDADALALGLRTAALRIRGCTAELDEMGEETDNVYTSTAKLAEKIEGLMNINGTGGVKILEDDEKTFRSIYDIFLDISKVYKDMSDTDASALLELIAGKNRASAISATLNNMSEAEQILQNSINAAGSAQKEYDTYLQSTEAHIARFRATLVETYSTFMNGDLISHTADMGTGILELVNNTDLLKHSILAVLALNIGNGITAIGAAIATTAKQMNTLGSALQQIKNLPMDDDLRLDALSKIGAETQMLTEKNLHLLLAQKKLSNQDKINILTEHNLTDEEAKAKLEKMGLLTATKAQSTANVTEAATIFTLKNAMMSLKASVVGVGSSLKAAFLSNPIGLSLMAITTIISVATTAISKHNEKLEETRRKNIEAATTAAENADKLKDLYNEYIRLSSIQDRTESQEEEFKDTVQNVTKALGDKAQMLEGLTVGTDEYAEALARATKEELQSQAVSATIGRKAAEETLQGDIWSDWSGSKVSIDTNSKGKAVSETIERAKDIVSDALEEFKTMNQAWKNLSWDLKSDDPIKALEYYNALVEAREALVMASKNDEALLDTEIYQDLNEAIGAMSEPLDDYIKMLYEEEKLNYMIQNGIPGTVEAYEAMEESLINAAGSSTDLQDKFKELLTADFTSLATDIGNVGNVVEDITSTFNISSYEQQLDGIQSTITTLRTALDSFNKGELDKIQVLDLMQQFPELAPYIDLAADGFGNLSEGLSMLIAQQPDSLVIELQKLKDSLTTDEERQQVDLLIDSLQRLSSYGDSGIEAYATTIGSTWGDTANVIDGVTSQFENLAKVQEAVADGLTMSATAAAELARMYPEILDHAQVTANGQITLNEEVVKNILDGDKSIIDAQIAKLEADKAVLEAKKETAIAELEIANQVGKAKGQISEEEARHQIEVLNAELNAEIEKNRQTVESYALGTQDKAQTATDFNIYAATVASDIASNMGKAAASMANSMKINSVNAQKSLSGIMQKAADVAKAIAEMATGTVTGAIDKVYESLGGVDSGGINISTSANSFTPTISNYLDGKVSLGEFKSGLETDIKGYIDAISNIDAQIEILKNLQASLGSEINGGIGGHGYADKIKDLEKEKEKLNDALKDKGGSGSDSTKEAKEEFSDTVDFFERRAKVLDKVLSLLKSSLDNVSGSFAKNKLVDAELGVTEEEFNNYTDALAMYTQKANEALSKLPADIAAKVKDGAVALTDFIGDGNKDVVEAIKEYEAWADKVSDCQQELAGLKKEIRQLELDKFNNIMDDFSNQFNLRGNSKDMISKQIDLLKEAGELIGESFFKAQIDQSQKQLGLLENEKAQLVKQMESAISSGRVQKGTDEWLSMIDSLNEVEGNILDCKKSIEEFDNELLNLHVEVFNRIQDRFSDLSSEISNIIGLFDGMEVSDDKGVWSKEGIAQLGLLAQQYELAQHQVQQYNDEIEELKAQYAAGKYSTTEYMDKLSQLSKEQWDAVNATEAAKDAILKLNEARVEAQIEGIEKEIDAYDELTQSQIDALKAEKDLHDYQNSISEKTKSVADLEKQIEAMRNDTSLASVARRKKLEEQLVEAKKALEEEQYQHSIETQQEALNKQFEDYEKSRNDEIESLRESLNDKETIISESFQTVKENTDIIGQEIASIAVNHGITVSDALISSWKSGENAVAGYGEALSQGTSAFIANIMGIESEMWNLQANANSTANTLAWMFSTKADNLVNELSKSFYAEANLANMTNALQNSLINALERGYNVSSIVNSLASVESAARSAKAALDAMNNAASGGGSGYSGGGGNTSSSGSDSDSGSSSGTASGWTKPDRNPTPPSGRPKPPQKATVSYEITSSSGKVLTTLDHYPSQEELATLRARFSDQLGANKNLKVNKVGGYANGVHNLDDDEVAWVSEKGNELIMSPSQNAILMSLKKGDTVLTKEQTDNMYEWSKRSPQEMYSMEDTMRLWGHMLNPAPLTTEYKVNNNAVNLHLDSMVKVEGSIDSVNVKQVESIMDKGINKLMRRLNDGMIYGR